MPVDPRTVRMQNHLLVELFAALDAAASRRDLPADVRLAFDAIELTEATTSDLAFVTVTIDKLCAVLIESVDDDVGAAVFLDKVGAEGEDPDAAVVVVKGTGRVAAAREFMQALTTNGGMAVN